MLNDKFTELNHKYNAFDYYKEKRGMKNGG